MIPHLFVLSSVANYLTNSMKIFTISEVSELSGLPSSTLRYYERIGLIRAIERDGQSGHRVYSQDDLDEIAIIACLSATGLSIDNMRAYLKNRIEGADKSGEQVEILNQRKRQLDSESRQLRFRLKYVEAKIAYWEAKQRGDTRSVQICTERVLAIADEMKLPRVSTSGGNELTREDE